MQMDQRGHIVAVSPAVLQNQQTNCTVCLQVAQPHLMQYKRDGCHHQDNWVGAFACGVAL
jgi:hypothetical protein